MSNATTHEDNVCFLHHLDEQINMIKYGLNKQDITDESVMANDYIQAVFFSTTIGGEIFVQFTNIIC